MNVLNKIIYNAIEKEAKTEKQFNVQHHSIYFNQLLEFIPRILPFTFLSIYPSLQKYLNLWLQSFMYDAWWKISHIKWIYLYSTNNNQKNAFIYHLLCAPRYSKRINKISMHKRLSQFKWKFNDFHGNNQCSMLNKQN